MSYTVWDLSLFLIIMAYSFMVAMWLGNYVGLDIASTIGMPIGAITLHMLGFAAGILGTIMTFKIIHWI